MPEGMHVEESETLVRSSDVASTAEIAPPTSAADVLRLQRLVGNRATSRLLARQPREPPDDHDAGVPTLPKDEPSAAGTIKADRYESLNPWLSERNLRYAASGKVAARTVVRGMIVQWGHKGARDWLTELKVDTDLMRADRSDISGVTPEWEALGRRIALREQAIPALEEELERFDEFLELFEARALVVTNSLLDLSERRIVEEQQRYGLERHTQLVERYDPLEKGMTYDFKTWYTVKANRQSEDMRKAADELAAKVAAVAAARGEQEAAMGVIAAEPPAEGVVWGIADEAKHAAGLAHEQEAQKRLDLLRYEKEAEFPVLAALVAIDGRRASDAYDTEQRLRRVAAGGDAGAGDVGAQVFKKLDNIRTVREGLADGEFNIWEMPDIVELTKRQMNVTPDSAYERAVNDRVEDAQSLKFAKDLLLGVLAVALAIAAAPLTGGASLGFGAAVVAGTAAVAGAGLSGYIAFEHLREYELQKAAGGTDFDRARALTQEDPSLFWLALDIVGAVADAAAAIRAFKAISTAARTAVRARRAAATAISTAGRKEVDELRQIAETEIQKAGGKAGLGRVVADSAEKQAVREGAELKGMYSKWEGELEKETRDMLEHSPKLDETFRKMDPEVREVLTHCSAVCIPPNVSEAQAARLRKLLDRIPTRHREGLKEFLYHERDRLDDAIKELEELFTKDLGADIDRQFAKLEAGELGREGPMVSGGRRGEAGDVPDLRGAEGAGQRVPLELLKNTQNVLGRKIADAPEAVQRCWRDAVAAAKRSGGELSSDNFRELYKDAQRKFWENIRKPDSGAMGWFTDHGFRFEGESGAPVVDIARDVGGRARKEFAIELDHILPKASGENWTRALDADNLRFLTGWDNWLLDQIARKLPELAP